MTKPNKISLIFTILNSLDVVTTLLLFDRKGFIEANPIMRYCLNFSPYLFTLVKLLFSGLMHEFIHRTYAKDQKLITFKIINWVFVVVVVNNLVNLVLALLYE